MIAIYWYLLFFFPVLWQSIVQIYFDLFSQSPVDNHLDCFRVLLLKWWYIFSFLQTLDFLPVCLGVDPLKVVKGINACGIFLVIANFYFVGIIPFYTQNFSVYAWIWFWVFYPGLLDLLSFHVLYCFSDRGIKN